MMNEKYPVLLENVSKFFKKNEGKFTFGIFNKDDRNLLKAVDDVSFNVKKGEMLGIIGLNGSGKTTLLRTIAGIYPPDKGTVIINGKLAPLLQIGVGFYNELFAKDNIILYGMLLGMKKSEITKKVDYIISFAELNEFKDMKLKYYSSGMRARLAFSTAMQIESDILLVDEVLSVGDLPFREKSFDSFLSFKKEGKTILYTSHNLIMLEKLCDRVLLLSKGSAIMIGSPVEVIIKYREMVSTKSNKKQ